MKRLLLFFIFSLALAPLTARALSLEEGIEGFTRIPAWTSGRETSLGSISPGKRSDMTVFEKNLFEVAPEDWTSIPVEMTMIDGEIVYQK